MRTQPWETAWPSEETSSVPWIPAPSKIPIQRALSGSAGPGGITWPARLPAQAELGTCQEGSTCLSWAW